MPDLPQAEPQGTPAPAADPVESLIAELAAAPKETPPVETKVPAETKPATPTTPPSSPPPADALVDERLRRIAAREAEARKAIDVERARLAEERTAKDAVAAKADAFEKLKAQFRVDPVATLRELGADEKLLPEIAKAAWYDALGDAAPKEAQENKSVQELRRQVMDLRRVLSEREARDQKAAAEAELQQRYQSDIGQFKADFAKIPDTYEFAKALATTKPDLTAAQLLALRPVYQQQHPYDDPPTSEQLIAMFEPQLKTELGPLVDYFVKKALSAAPAADKNQPATKTLTSALSAHTPARNQPANEEELVDNIVDDLRQGKHQLS